MPQCHSSLSWSTNLLGLLCGRKDKMSVEIISAWLNAKYQEFIIEERGEYPTAGECT